MRKSLFHSMIDQDTDFMLSLYRSYYGYMAEIVLGIVKEQDNVEGIVQESILNLARKRNDLRKLSSNEKKLRREILRVTEWTAKLATESLKTDPTIFLGKNKLKSQNKGSNWIFIEKAIQKKELGKMIERLPSNYIPLLRCKFGLQKSDAEVIEQFCFKNKGEMEKAFKTASALLLKELKKEYEDK